MTVHTAIRQFLPPRAASGRRHGGRAPFCRSAAPGEASRPRLVSLVLAALCSLMAALTQPAAAADAALALEYKVKAGYLYNFAKHVEWPTNLAPGHATTPGLPPIVIGVLGGAEVFPILQQVLHGKSMDGRPLQLKLVTKPSDKAGCQILFVHHASGQTPEQIQQAISNAPTLVVGESEQFAERGGMIGFVRHQERFRLHLNLDASNRAGLKVSAKLSSVARIVRNRQDP